MAADEGNAEAREASPWVRRLGPPILLLSTLVLTLVAVEVVLRVTGFFFPLRAVVVEATGPAPEVLYQRYMLERDLIWVPRDYDDELARALSDPPDVLFLGDSCTELGAYDQRFMQLLRTAGLGPVASENFGVAGWSSHQGLAQVRRDVTRIRPKVVTIYFGWNDHWNSIGIPDGEVSELIKRPLFRNQALRLVQLLNRAYVGMRLRGQSEPPLRVPPEEFRQNLTEMVSLVDEYGGTPVLLTAPTSHTPGQEPAYLAERWVNDLSELVPLHRSYQDAVRAVAQETGAPLCDVAARFDALPPETVRDDLFLADGIHLRPAGDTQLAEFLFECFQEEGLLGRLTP